MTTTLSSAGAGGGSRGRMTSVGGGNNVASTAARSAATVTGAAPMPAPPAGVVAARRGGLRSPTTSSSRKQNRQLDNSNGQQRSAGVSSSCCSSSSKSGGVNAAAVSGAAALLAAAALSAAAIRAVGGIVRRARRGAGGGVIVGGGAPPVGATAHQQQHRAALVWLRSDLRLADHPALVAACAGAASVAPVYCFDPREFAGLHNSRGDGKRGRRGSTGSGSTGSGSGSSSSGPQLDTSTPYRAALIIRALRDLRAALRARGGDLLVRVGRPEDVLPALAREAGAARVYCHGESTPGERAVEAAVARALSRSSGGAGGGGDLRLEVLRGACTLLAPEDLPFGAGALPLKFAEFRDRIVAAAGRKQGARAVPVRPPLEAPAVLKPLPEPLRGSGDVDGAPAAGDIPSLAQLGFVADEAARAEAAADDLEASFSAEERRALDHLRGFADAAEGDEGAAAAAAAAAAPTALLSRAAPWLSAGCVSPRSLYYAARPRQQQQQQQGKQQQQDDRWLLFELLWRDFFRLWNEQLCDVEEGDGQSAAPTTAAAAAAATTTLAPA